MASRAAAVAAAAAAAAALTSTLVKRRKVNLKAKLESSASRCSLKCLVSGDFNMGLIGLTCNTLPWP
jgi:hypothetical protein